MIPLALLVATILRPSLRERFRAARGQAAWVLLTILLIGAEWAKGVMLTMLVGPPRMYLL